MLVASTTPPSPSPLHQTTPPHPTPYGAPMDRSIVALYRCIDRSLPCTLDLVDCHTITIPQLVPRLRKFNRDLTILNTVLTDLIARAKSSESKADLEDLQARNYDKVSRDEIV